MGDWGRVGLGERLSMYESVDLTRVYYVDDWVSLDESLAGSRAKQTLVNPTDDRLYVFKEPKPRREAQIWSELIASFIAGDLLGWAVQHTSIAVREGRYGNLLGYIFEPHDDSFIMGEQICKHIDPEFDPEVGTRHTWSLIKQINQEFILPGQDGIARIYVSAEYERFWARTIAFDTLISNTDRHAENWAFLVRPGGDLMAPLYDNASSLGCEVDAVGLERWFDQSGALDEARVARYTRQGCHHLREDGRRLGFEELTRMALTELPKNREDFEAVANLDLTPLNAVLDEIQVLEGVSNAVQMTDFRRAQILSLLREGQARVIRSLEEKT